MKETGMLFTSPMVRAILEGRKTQTRRVAKPVKHPDLGNLYTPGALAMGREPQHVIDRACPLGQPGDRIYVRETARSCRAYEVQGYPPSQWGNKPIWFEADGTPPGAETAWATKATPAIHLPMFAARIWLEVTGVRLELIQDISEADAIAEGVNRIAHGREGSYYSAIRNEQHPKNWIYPDDAFRELWESTGGDWNANPMVWAIEFKVLSTIGRPK